MSKNNNIQVPILDNFLNFSLQNHTAGSNAPASYVRALMIVDKVLKTAHLFLNENEHIWDVTDEKLLIKIYVFLKDEQHKPNGGIFAGALNPGYWKHRYCSSSVKELAKFQLLFSRQMDMFRLYDTEQDALVLAQKLQKTKFIPSQMLLDDAIDINTDKGKTLLKEAKNGQNQYVFRKLVLHNYNSSCCVTGLPVTELLRVSCIEPCSYDKKNYMNLENALCLSATYDAAFESHLISFDDNYRMVLSNSLNEYCTKDVCKYYFKNFEGKQIALPMKFMPSKALLEAHREHLA